MLIKNGFLIDPASDTERLVDLRITDGLIQTLADAGTLTPENGEDELDAAGLMISPGLVDTHIHFRDPGFTYKEDLHTVCSCSCCRWIYFRDLYGKYFTGH